MTSDGNLWPTADEVKRLFDLDSDEWDEHIEQLLEAAISQVKRDVGNWDEESDVPDDALRNAALRAAMILRVNAETAESALQADPIYQSWMTGRRRRFHIG